VAEVGCIMAPRVAKERRSVGAKFEKGKRD
jgi:hypothetical protein